MNNYSINIKKHRGLDKQNESWGNMGWFFGEIFCGGLANLTTVYTSYPLTRVHYVQQLNNLQPSVRIPPKTISALSRILSVDGIGGLWRGCSTRIYSLIVPASLRFGVFNHFVNKEDNIRTINYFNNEFCYPMTIAFLSTSVTSLMVFPWRKSRTLLNLDSDVRKAYNNVAELLIGATERLGVWEGLKYIYRGYLSSFIVGVPYYSISLGGYYILKQQLHQYNNGGDNDESNNNNLNNVHLTRESWNAKALNLKLLSGILAVSLATLIVHPIDKIRRERLILKQVSASVAIRSALKTQGASFLFKGLFSSLSFTVPGMVSQLLLFDIYLYYYDHLFDE